MDAHWLGARCTHLPARTLRPSSGKGPLAGLRFAVKDVIAVAGVSACFGQPTWLQTHEPAARDAEVVTALAAAGAGLEGVTLTDELALSLTGENAHYGTPTNPAAPERIPGGSSSGSAAAVASGAVDFALGTDTGGSVRVPASHCGVLGFRPTHGVVSTDGVLPLARSFDTVGWFARDADQLERVGDVLLPPTEAAGPRALWIAGDAEVLLDDDARAPFRNAAETLARALGLPVQNGTLGTPHTGPLAGWIDVYLTLQNEEVRREHAEWIARAQPRFGSLIGRRFERVLTAAPSTQLADARAIQRAVAARLAELLAPGTWVILPSAPGAPLRRGTPDDAVDAFTGRALTLAAPASLAGLPQVSLPLASVAGAPLGVSLVGPAGSDRALLARVRALSALVDSAPKEIT